MKINLESSSLFFNHPDLYHLEFNQGVVSGILGSRDANPEVLKAHKLAIRILVDSSQKASKRSFWEKALTVIQRKVSSSLKYMQSGCMRRQHSLRDLHLMKASHLKIVIRSCLMADLNQWVLRGGPREKRHEAASKILHVFDNDLRFLQIINLNLTTLPEGIGYLGSVMEIMANGNHLTTLPESIGDLLNLTKLSFCNNHLETLPDSLSRLKKLELLNVRSNRLTALPDAITQLPNLEGLFASYNLLSQLPASLGQLPKLVELNLGHNQFLEFPEVVFDLPNLRRLELEYNQIQALPEDIGRLRFLNHFMINHNLISQLPDSLFGLFGQIHAESNRFNAPQAVSIQTRLSRVHHGRLEIYFDVFEERASSTLDPSFKDLVMDIYQKANLDLELKAISQLETNELKTFLIKFKKMAIFENSSLSGQGILCRKLALILNSTLTNISFKNIAEDVIKDSSTACGDRIAIGFNKLIQLFDIFFILKEKSLLETAAYFISCKRKELIEQIAMTRDGDQVETALRLQILLKERLNLHMCVDDMLYPGVANCTVDEIDDIARKVIANSTDWVSILCCHELWQEKMRALHEEVYEEIANSHAIDTNQRLNLQYQVDTQSWILENQIMLNSLI